MIYLCRKFQRTDKKKNLQVLMSDYSTVRKYKVNIQKSIVFSYGNNKQFKSGIKNTTLH